jgi:hypothetical protein
VAVRELLGVVVVGARGAEGVAVRDAGTADQVLERSFEPKKLGLVELARCICGRCKVVEHASAFVEEVLWKLGDVGGVGRSHRGRSGVVVSVVAHAAREWAQASQQRARATGKQATGAMMYAG